MVSVLLLMLLRHSIFLRVSTLSSSHSGTGSFPARVVMMAASQGRMGEPAIRNLVTTWTCMKSRAKTVIAVAWTTYTKHSLPLISDKLENFLQMNRLNTDALTSVGENLLTSVGLGTP